MLRLGDGDRNGGRSRADLCSRNREHHQTGAKATEMHGGLLTLSPSGDKAEPYFVTGGDYTMSGFGFPASRTTRRGSPFTPLSGKMRSRALRHSVDSVPGRF